LYPEGQIFDLFSRKIQVFLKEAIPAMPRDRQKCFFALN
jgi:hypothetical protein